MEPQPTPFPGKPPFVSVVIPTYNRREYLRDTLESVLAQKFVRFEVVVVDDGSTDGTEELLRRYRNRIHYIHQENLGAAGARNTGIRMAKGDYLAFMDSGDLAMPDHLQTLYGFLEGHPSCAMVMGNGAYLEGEFHHRRSIISAGRARRLERDVSLREIFDGRVVRLQGMMVHKACLEKVGLLDESLRISHELDLAFRLIQRHRIGFINREVFLYRKQGGHISGDDEVRSRENLRALDKLTCDYPGAEDLIGRRVLRYHRAYRHYKLGRSLFKKGDVGGARAAIGEALALRPFSLKYRICRFRWSRALPEEVS